MLHTPCTVYLSNYNLWLYTRLVRTLSYCSSEVMWTHQLQFSCIIIHIFHTIYKINTYYCLDKFPLSAKWTLLRGLAFHFCRYKRLGQVYMNVRYCLYYNFHQPSTKHKKKYQSWSLNRSHLSLMKTYMMTNLTTTINSWINFSRPI